MPKVRFRSALGEWSCDVHPATTLLEAAEQCGAYVGHSCGGACACSTCHVWVKQGEETLSPQLDDEMDRLDQAFDVRAHSRLACQAKVFESDIEVTITEESLSAYLDENPQLRKPLEKAGKWPLK